MNDPGAAAGTSDCRAALMAALGFLQLRDQPPAVAPLRRWLDSWTGIGATPAPADRTVTSLLLVLMTVLLLPSCLPAQQREQHWLVGRWDGTIADYPGTGSPARTLEVTKVEPDGRAEAIWYITGQRTARAEVTVTASRVKVITVAKSIVDLTRDGESLVGTFVLHDGRSFAIKMTRRP